MAIGCPTVTNPGRSATAPRRCVPKPQLMPRHVVPRAKLPPNRSEDADRRESDGGVQADAGVIRQGDSSEGGTEALVRQVRQENAIQRAPDAAPPMRAIDVQKLRSTIATVKSERLMPPSWRD